MDNATTEHLFGSLKTERLFFTRCDACEEAGQGIVDYMEMFSHCKRLHSYLCYDSPKRFERIVASEIDCVNLTKVSIFYGTMSTFNMNFLQNKVEQQSRFYCSWL